MNEITILHLIVGPTLLFVSCVMKIWPPKKINSFYGYRTPRSMKNQLTWDEANTYSANLMMWAGISTILVQVISYFTTSDTVSLFITIGYYLAFILVIVFLTEKRLAGKKF